MAASIRAFASDHPSADYEHLVARFGSPEQIAATYVDEMESGELINSLRIKRKILCLVVGAVIMALIIWLGYLRICYLEVKENTGYIVVGGIIEEERTENIEGGN